MGLTVIIGSHLDDLTDISPYFAFAGSYYFEATVPGKTRFVILWEVWIWIEKARM